MAVWAPNDIFHTIQDLNLAVWCGIAIRTCMRKKIGQIFIWRFKGIPPNFPAIWYVRDVRLTHTRSTAQFTFSTFQKLCPHHDAHIHTEVTCSPSLPLPSCACAFIIMRSCYTRQSFSLTLLFTCRINVSNIESDVSSDLMF